MTRPQSRTWPLTKRGRIGASTVVLSELYRGLLIGQDVTSEEAMSKYEWVEPVPFTNGTATEAAELRVELRADGGMINESDVYIAGTARSLGVSLVVGDDHFGAVDDLTVETYRT
nr:PIN domain-containing protein [Haloplanus salinus]